MFLQCSYDRIILDFLARNKVCLQFGVCYEEDFIYLSGEYMSQPHG